MTGVSPDDGVLSEILNALEDLELPLITWGVTSVELAYSEVVTVIEERLTDDDPEQVLTDLIAGGLIIKIPGSSPPTYRTRMAETVRLASTLRQLFPPRYYPDSPPQRWWLQGKPLVADYRLHVAPRRYPKRDIDSEEAVHEFGAMPGWDALHSDVTRAQIQGFDLARFQVDATRSIFRSASGRQSCGIIVGAGTGSGKTRAFYLPAFALMAGRSGRRSGNRRVQTLALYPRNELLRDQLKEAVRTVRVVNEVLRTRGKPPLRIGVLYGDTPHNANFRHHAHFNRAWRRHGQDSICPYLSCPECDSDLVWPEAERSRRRESLRCVNCSVVLREDELLLTRNALKAMPPDLLFTTTEMLNRNATDQDLGRVLGWRGGGAPSLVLLDEVHTYEGVHGAQVGLLLRRWRHSAAAPMTFVGLSATLRDAGRFFAQLVGLDETAVDHIEPATQDLVAEGREYAIALRGDPISGSDLLSTSIQAAMLFGRIMDPGGRERLYGSRGFLFTDDLDVTNRFYDYLRQAEGGQSRGGRSAGPARRVLAALRSPAAKYEDERFRDGQSWNVVQQIGRHLPKAADAGALRIGRTSSQDTGVDRSADLVVCTASLEVGFNDPRVGLILQHKAPHNPAAFIQRRGRAGRRRETRPWTVVTLSDYGRDRLAYQAYDSLFNPMLQMRTLPVRNRYVLRIQGAQALLDWLGEQLRARGIAADPRKLLTAPREQESANGRDEKALIGLLLDVLGGGEGGDEVAAQLEDDLAMHLRRSLEISVEEAQALLWEPPRALMSAVIPTALRRLVSEWNPAERDPGADPGDLLPEYMTRTLFDALNVPEVWMNVPFGGIEAEALSIEHALREAVPGRVSRRYGYRRDEHRTWLPLPATGDTLELSDIVEAGAKQGHWQGSEGRTVEVIRPYAFRLASPRDDIASSSQGIPFWASQIVQPAGRIETAVIPDPSPWKARVRTAGFATHAAGNPVEIRRMTTGARCETIYAGGRAESRTVRYAVDGQPAALGFALTADAMRLELAPLDLDLPEVAQYMATPSWRSVAFTAGVLEDPALDDVANVFQREWLVLVYLTAFALKGLSGDGSGVEIHKELADGAWRDDLENVLQALYRDASADGSSGAPERLISRLREVSHDPRVSGSLDRHGELLIQPDVRGRTAKLAQKVYHQTIAAAVLTAIQRTCPDAQDRDLIIDVDQDSSSSAATVWLSETSIGGLGVIEHVVEQYGRDPRRFWGLVETALGPTEHEYVDAAIIGLLENVVANPTGTAAQAIKQLRDASTAHAADVALGRLRAAWAEFDGPPSHSAVVTLSTRLLRPGSTPATDRAALGIVRTWSELEARLGFEVDARVVAFAVGFGHLQVPEMTRALSTDQVFSILWPRGHHARTQHLGYYHPYAGRPVLDRLLVAAAHDDRLPTVDVTQRDWENRYATEIVAHDAVELVAPVSQVKQLSDALRRVVAVSVETDYLRVYGEVQKFCRVGRQYRARVAIREAVQ